MKGAIQIVEPGRRSPVAAAPAVYHDRREDFTVYQPAGFWLRYCALTLDGSLSNATFMKDPFFGFEVPVAVAGVDSKLLDPRGAWADAAEYDKTAHELVSKFVENFAQFVDHVDEGVRAAAPVAAAVHA